MVAQKVQRLADAGQHAERQHVDLHQPERVDVVAVPFDEGAVLHRGIADRHRLVEPASREDEAADMLRKMARKADQLIGEIHCARDLRIVRRQARLPHMIIRQILPPAAPDGGGQSRSHVLRQPQHLADFADGAARPVGDDGRGDAGAVATVALVDVLDDLLAPLMLEIDVDVGRLLALLRKEAGEQQVDFLGIDIGDAEDEADRRIGGRAAPLAEDALVVGEADDVVDR